MPELPEVEVIRRHLVPILLDRTIEQVWVRSAPPVFLTPPRILAQKLLGEGIIDIGRRGKYLIFALGSGARLLVHLGMTGQLRLVTDEIVCASPSRPRRRSETVLDRHVHLKTRFSGTGLVLLYRDPRRFGRLQWLDATDRSPRLDRLGPEALTVSGRQLQGAAHGRRVAVKSFLLDQHALAGVGNIYADEALFLARILPTRGVQTLHDADWRKLSSSLCKVLDAAIQRGGSSIDDYVRPDGTTGRFQTRHRVYGRTGQPCPSCRTPVDLVRIGQRSAHFCRRCQR